MSDTSVKQERPLSPHLQIYKWQLNMATSIFHRITGVALTVGLLLVIWGLFALADSREAYEYFTAFCSTWIGQLMLVGWSFAFYYHLCTGIRHLIFDAGWFVTINGAVRTGWIVLGLPVILTAATWFYIYCGGAA